MSDTMTPDEVAAAKARAVAFAFAFASGDCRFCGCRTTHAGGCPAGETIRLADEVLALQAAPMEVWVLLRSGRVMGVHADEASALEDLGVRGERASVQGHLIERWAVQSSSRAALGPSDG